MLADTTEFNNVTADGIGRVYATRGVSDICR